MKSDLTTIYIMRHGESEANLQKRFGTMPETKLTDFGKEQAKQAAERFKQVHFDKIFSSDFLRAKHTAEIIAQEKKLAVTTTQALRERSYGRMDGKTRDKFSFKLVDDMESAIMKKLSVAIFKILHILKSKPMV